MEKTKTPFLIVKYVIKYTYLTLMGFQFCIDDFIPCKNFLLHLQGEILGKRVAEDGAFLLHLHLRNKA